MNLTRYEPCTLINLFQRDLDRLAGRHFALTGDDGDDGAPVADWLPPVDIVEEKERFVLRADVPGVAADDLEISMENGILSIAGSRHREKTAEVDGLRRIERVSGKFYRRFTLPETADADNIAASCANGILELTIPKRAQVLAKRIAVQAA